jgi:two-component system cell cycle sensor histidine kinase/response regulator CckA
MSAESRIRELEDTISRLQHELVGSRRSVTGTVSTDASLLGVFADRTVLENFPDVIVIMSRDQRILYLNRTAGRSIEDTIGSDALEFISPAERAKFVERFERSWQSGEACTLELNMVSGNTWETRLAPIRVNGEQTLMLGTSRDITQRLARRDSESLRLALDATGMGIWTWRADTDQLTWDRTACAILGLPESAAESTGAAFIALVHPEDRDRVREAISRSLDTGDFGEIDHRVVLPTGELRHISTRGTLIRDEHGVLLGFRGGVIDVTARKRFEQQLSHGQKMEAIGQLTAGIAHNFNNLLSVIVPNVGLARHSHGADLMSCLDDIDHAARRATDLVQQLTLFTRQSTDTRRDSIDITALVHRTVQICRGTFQRVIRIELEMEPELPRVSANAGQIEQVLLNICINARDALLDSGIERPQMVLHVDRHDGFVRIRVIDNGPGMEERVRVRVFEPFFTTKAIGRGTGLGLASAYAIVTEHKGRISCETPPGAGSVFTVELPQASAHQTAQAANPFASPAAAPRASAETVLIADSDPLPRRALASMLAFGGYRVLEAGTAQQLFMHFGTNDTPPVDLVLLDAALSEPSHGSEQLLARLQRLAGKVPIIMLLAAGSVRDGAARTTSGLAKPVAANTLFGTIRAALDGTRSV